MASAQQRRIAAWPASAASDAGDEERVAQRRGASLPRTRPLGNRPFRAFDRVDAAIEKVVQDDAARIQAHRRGDQPRESPGVRAARNSISRKDIRDRGDHVCRPQQLQVPAQHGPPLSREARESRVDSTTRAERQSMNAAAAARLAKGFAGGSLQDPWSGIRFAVRGSP